MSEDSSYVVITNGVKPVIVADTFEQAWALFDSRIMSKGKRPTHGEYKERSVCRIVVSYPDLKNNDDEIFDLHIVDR